MDEKKRDYVYGTLGHNIHTAIRQGLQNGIIEAVPTESNREDIFKWPKLDDEVHS